MTPAPIYAEIGKTYDVQCMPIEYEHLPPMFYAKKPQQTTARWVPIIGPEHADPELGFKETHYHIDWRFVGEKVWKRALTAERASMFVLRTDYLYEHERRVERIKMRCHRAAPVIGDWAFFEGSNFCELQLAMCNERIKNGICPHKGIDLKPFSRPDGTATCPGHGLRWNLKTGELIWRTFQEAAHSRREA